jgi:pimeloyl-ACP methyl ester carboxylesterase
MIATEQGGHGAVQHRGRSAFLDLQVERAMMRLLELGAVSATSHHGQIDGQAVHYLSAGDGPVLLLLHGAGGGAANWYRLLMALSRRYRVIAPDLPGFGLSDAIVPAAPLGRQVAKYIATLLSQVSAAPDYIVGTSFGGLAAMRLAEAIPFRRMVLIDPAGFWRDASLALRLACMPGFQRLGLKQTRRGARWAVRHILTSRRLPPEHELALADYISASAARTNLRLLARAYSLFGGYRGQSEVITNADFERWSERTLIVWGERDRFLPARDRRRAAALAAGAQLRIIPGVGHSPNWEAPDEVLRLMLDFFDGKKGD